jgi:hypothetical protein
MGHKYKHKELYNKKYPNYLSWNKAIWITRKGDTIINNENDEQYIVDKIELTPIVGIPPKIYVSKVNK